MATTWQQIVSSRVYLLLIHIFLWMLSVGLLLPHITAISENYFASKIEGDVLVCEDYDVAPPACTAGSAVAVKWAAWTSFASNAICAFTIVPLVGWLSDQHGRKPFLVLGQLLSMLPMLWLFLYIRSPLVLPYWGIYFLDAIKGCVNPVALCLSYTADVVSTEFRSTTFGLLLAMLSVGTIIASLLGYVMGAVWASLFSVLGLAANAAFVCYILPESLSAEAKEKARAAGESSQVLGIEGIRESFKIVRRSPLFARLAALMAISGMVFECLKDVLLLYLAATLSFKRQETAILFVMMGFSGFFVQTALLPALLTGMGEKMVLVIALACSTAEMAILAGATEIWMAYVAILIGAGGSMAFPAISAISSANSHIDEQGAVQGALYGMKGLASGIGPLFFSAAYTYCSQPEHFMPNAPLIGASVFMFGGLLIAVSVQVPNLRSCGGENGMEGTMDSSDVIGLLQDAGSVELGSPAKRDQRVRRSADVLRPVGRELLDQVAPMP